MLQVGLVERGAVAQHNAFGLQQFTQLSPGGLLRLHQFAGFGVDQHQLLGGSQAIRVRPSVDGVVLLAWDSSRRPATRTV